MSSSLGVTVAARRYIKLFWARWRRGELFSGNGSGNRCRNGDGARAGGYHLPDHGKGKPAPAKQELRYLFYL